jgi:hypothetical protein
MMMNLFKDFSVLSWNVRGAVNRGGKRHCKELVRNYFPTFFFVVVGDSCFFVAQVEKFWKNIGSCPVAISEHIV